MNKIITMLIISIVLNVWSIIAQHIENGEVLGFQTIGLSFQIIAVILLF